MLISQNPDFFSFREIQIFFYFAKSRFRNFAKSIFRKIQLAIKIHVGMVGVEKVIDAGAAKQTFYC